MTHSQSLETFVNSIRNLYQKLHQQTLQHSSPNNATDSAQQQQSSSTTKVGSVNYLEIYNTINANLDVFSENANNLLDNVLPIFTLPEYTLPNMAVLYGIITQVYQQAKTTGSSDVDLTRTNLTPANQEKLFTSIENCIQFSDERQVDVATEIYSELCHFYTNKLCQMNRPKKGLLLIKTAIDKIQYDVNSEKIRENQLTSVHSDLLQLSLAAKNFSLALQVMSQEILDINKPPKCGFDSRYILSYFYYCGCIYASLKQYDDSLFYFEQALCIPATAFSQIMIEAYKKFILISLISKGKLVSLPKYTSRIVINQIKTVCAAYNDLAAAYVNYEQDKFHSLSHKHADAFVQDKNYGLVKQLQQSFYKKNIQKLTKTFITLSLADMAVKVRLATAKDAENLMLNMIRDGEIFATINQKDGMVSFHDNPEKFDNPAIMGQLMGQMFKCIKMDASIKEMDKEITTHPQYIQKCQTNMAAACDDGVDQLLQ